MNSLRLAVVTGTLLGLKFAVASAELPGKWRLEMDPGLIGQLEFRIAANGLVGFVEGGPIDVVVDGDDIHMVIDSRDQSMRRFDRVLTGRISGDSLEGTYTSSNDSESVVRSWHATPWLESENSRSEAPRPVNLSGMWGGASGKDMRKYRMDTTPLAEDFVASYDADLDQPPMRCMSPGVVAIFGAPYLLEILQLPDRIVFLHESFMQARHVYMDGRVPPDFYPVSRMGYSVGHWEGSTLVVETTHIQANVRDYRGEPLSDDTRVVERYDLEDDGQTLVGVMTIFDPVNYRQPPIRRTARARAPGEVALPYECDPDSFFRQLDREDRLDEYFSRSDRRL